MDHKNLAIFNIATEFFDVHPFIGLQGLQQCMTILTLTSSETLPCRMTGGTTEQMASYVHSASS
jgi:hypothetical protein